MRRGVKLRRRARTLALFALVPFVAAALATAAAAATATAFAIVSIQHPSLVNLLYAGLAVFTAAVAWK